jgi:hypothetical protein
MKAKSFFYSMAITAILFLSMGVVLKSSIVEAQQKGKSGRKEIVLRGQKGTANSNDKDANIVNDSQLNDPAAKNDPPSVKGGPKTRGGLCEVRFDNWTNLFIKLYVDGRFKGTIAPYGDAIAYAIPGETVVYGRADYTNGTFSYWGPTTYSCNAGQYIYFKMVE